MSISNAIFLYILIIILLSMNPQAHRSTEELKTIVKALSKLRLLNTPEEDQRLFECEQELRKRKREDDFIDAHFQVITYYDDLLCYETV